VSKMDITRKQEKCQAFFSKIFCFQEKFSSEAS